jgi:hypothetical protein
MSTAHDFTVFRRVAGDKIAELMERAERAERELAVKDKEIANMTEALEAVLESPLPARTFFTLADALKTKKEASK